MAAGFCRDGLGAEVLLHRDGVVGAALHRGVIGEDHGRTAFDAADAGNDAAAGCFTSIKPVAGELADLEKGEPGSSRRSIRSRGSSLPRARCLWRAVAPPPSAATATFSRKSATSARMALTFSRNSGEDVLMAERMSVTGYWIPVAAYSCPFRMDAAHLSAGGAA